ncbi:hypothetical protein SKAU_G00049320 [Synaphobranchus kaupii]|uniref:Cystatin fetuin-B-type domain-containing protein n=1 Tax=Synaphobranchus kaupii TaxID=118154 RepID=A0A9Q1G3N8_SYNKA|nr:hypothetical protein SKAU_G00049320 [Synaphobranchus kaupii]
MMLWVLLLSAGFCFQCVTGSLALVTSLTCETPAVLKGAKLALNKINADRQEGYIFTLNQVHDVRQESKEPSGVAYNLIIDVLETKCHVISKKNMQACEVRGAPNVPIYGQCKAIIYINKVKRIVRLYRYSCIVRPAAPSRISRICPDCPSMIDQDDKSVLTTVEMSLEKYNRESGNANYF